MQSCIRRRRCRLRFKILKAEAKSSDHLKQVNYKLESKIVELSQKMAAKNEEVTGNLERINALESQVGFWKEKHAKLEADFKALELSNNADVRDLKLLANQLTTEKEMISKDQEKTLALLKKRDDRLAQLTEELSNQNNEITRLLSNSKNAAKEVEEKTLLEKEVASLREQMSRMVAGKYATDKQTEKFLNTQYANNTKSPVPASGFFETASKQFSQSWIGSSSNLMVDTLHVQSNANITEEDEFSYPKDVQKNFNIRDLFEC